MMDDSDRFDKTPPSGRNRFATTHWSVVVTAGLGASQESREALGSLCENYWYPLYAYVRRRGHQPAEAQDLTQGFLTQLIEKGSIQAADETRGRFRSFLLGSLNHFLSNQWRHDQTQKRGGPEPTLSLDMDEGERRYDREPVDTATPERIYERRWAMTLLNKAVETLRAEYELAGKLSVFDELKVYLGGEDSSVPYREIGRRLESSEGAVRVAVHRLRRRCRECLRHEIAQTVASSEDIDQELRHLFQAVKG